MKFFVVLCALVAAVAADVSHLPSSEYLPPQHQHAASAPDVSYSAPADQSYHVEAASAPAVQYSAPVQSYHAEDVSAPVQSYHVEAASSPAVSHSAPAASYESSSYDSGASEPAHTYSSAEGYRYKTNRRRVYRQRVRRDVSHLASSEYLPPHQHAASSPSNDYLPPVATSGHVAQYESAPAISYSAPSYSGASYSVPSYSASSYESGASYSAPSYSGASYSAPSYSVPSYSASSYESDTSEPAHTYSDAEGYRYKTNRRRVIRRRS